MKILILRFSSIGDIVLTTPLLRSIKNQKPEIEIHYLLKKKYKEILQLNPNISKLYSFSSSIKEVTVELKKENYDLIIDLHHNLRTLILKTILKKPSNSFPKLNFYKWLLVRFKINKLPNIHIIDRYFSTLRTLNIFPDNKECEYFLHDFTDEVKNILSENYIAVSIGAQFFTKQIPIDKLKEIIQLLPQYNFILLGDKNDFQKGENLISELNSQYLINLCGKTSLNSSVHVLQKAKVLLTGDSGLMHIATCFKVPIVSLWGNTVPDFGMSPYYPNNQNLSSIFEVKNLSCRPCSKIGFKACPKKHFSCMMKQDTNKIAEQIKKYVEKN
ncbi:MAG: glycosyltransferase family 9 protein [Flavobacteriia bacterium]|nr:glycosyltransferase family 9 protein [Flavobacteriia bacterium]